jgi:hypothetical protein
MTKKNLISGFTLGLALLGAAAMAQAQTYTTLDDHPLGIGQTIARGISGNNIVGYYTDSSDNVHGFLYNGSTYTTLDDPLGALGTYARGISGNNILGYYYDSVPKSYGFLYNGSTYTPLNCPLSAHLTVACGIDGNNIVGVYVDSSGNLHSFEASIEPAPEPSTLALSGMGVLAGLLIFRRRK